MNRRTHIAALIAVSATLFGLTSPAAAETREINFGFISTESSNNLKAAWQPLIDDLQKATGLKVNTFFAPDYAGVIEAMRFNKIQLAWMGNKSAMEAVDRAGGEVFARVVNVDGTQGYWSLMIVHKDSPLKTLDDVIRNRQNLSLGFGDVNSTSGSLVPGYYAFGAHKVDPARDFKRSVRSNHETNILAVAGKQVDVATVASDGVERMKIKMPEKAAELREVWRSPLIASDPLVWRKDLDEATKKRLREFFQTYGRDAREKANLAKLTLSGFVASDNLQLLPIRQLELARERGKVEADAALGAEDKARKLKDIDTRLAELAKAK
ncbi:phosphonate ABC transporter substrate-binding protein [Aquabacterium sp. A7-Y]|uniref:phosphonate ABC transporter substrate-binding protein n=1 Tax=Aquabacterium sp. A7-Y TaxID=1349605 RepID=UPI00223DAD45|nr:phosphonate ABC transporter substrate-binding protein [Aquabacterium sp. A7-Y]MCW7541351.1 phosphonate ABC transporter substrate-binding protein [Aquabacterium sp. A7-Y]